nr:DNA-3-methyladenine glycosylase-like [Ipomoea batatas]
MIKVSSSTKFDSSVTPLDQKIAFALRLIAPPERREALANRNAARQQPSPSPTPSPASSVPSDDNEEVKRCNWGYQNSDKVYVQFHDECWGVPVYDDHQLFELLALSGMLMDFNWTEILKKGEDLFRGRVRHIVEKPKCTVKASREGIRVFQKAHGEKRELQTVINRFRSPKNFPLRSPKAKNHSKVFGENVVPVWGARVIVFLFMQAEDTIIPWGLL